MAIVHVLHFDAAIEAAIFDIWRRISDAGYPSALDDNNNRPHLTLGTYETIDFDMQACMERVADFARNARPFPVLLTHIGLFTAIETVVFLGLAPTAALLAMHRNALALCHNFTHHLRPYYELGEWTPHVTLSSALTREQALGILSLGWEINLPISGQVQAIRIVEVTPTYARDIFFSEFGG